MVHGIAYKIVVVHMLQIERLIIITVVIVMMMVWTGSIGMSVSNVH